ncbi:hypothetical protein [Hymenobacter weizhouensis]|uniref:hypothetical protein n=1 Tax=Hymenobacter sp. YIM 151500-1 TaxID=2987689 RepID=UPI002227E35E|nr:hypothetical protein [Hymenobacter sp. YIM 151500-1]UYZ65155.1 hypothetical protein OIS53_09965 [Hymenobacter sp. YIM 151500-1]
MSRIKRLAAVGMAWILATTPALAEMMKNRSVGEILWTIIFFVAGIPFIIGLIAFWLVALLKNKRPSLLAITLPAFGGWWGGLYLIWQYSDASGSDTLWLIVLSVLVLTVALGLGSVDSSAPDEGI